jgi:hypothetical protein|tara:strand:+ start:353 stop:607 length:255 start_codon:yes stop_codon:yes gene_type:complete
MKVDLHGLPLSEAKLKSQISVAEAWSNAFSTIELVHGHNLGTVIKDYIQQGGLLADIERIYPEIPNLIIKDNGLGSTIVRFKRS